VTVRGLAFGFLFIYAIRMAAVFMIVVSTIGMRLGVLPRWLVVAGYAAALVLIFNVSYLETLVLVFPAWVAAVSIVILKAGRSDDGVDAVRSAEQRDALGQPSESAEPRKA
jgi:hypothetical protein